MILPVRDRAWCLERAIRSVLDQTYEAIELIVIDDGSTDDSAAIARSFAPRVQLIEQPPLGVYHARNRALAASRGELIAFIDSDDRWLPEKLALQVPLFERPEVGLVYGDVRHVDGALKPLRPTSFAVAPPHRGWVREAFAQSNFIPTITAVLRRRCLEEIGGFPEWPLSSDMLTWFRISRRHEVDYVDAVLADYTVHERGISFELGAAVIARIELFEAELRSANDEETRRVVRRILFTLALRLIIAALRGRCANRAEALKVSRRTLSAVAGPEAPRWSASFLKHEIQTRSRRFIHE